MVRLTYHLQGTDLSAPTQPVNLAFAAAAAARASWASKERNDDLWDLDSPREDALFDMLPSHASAGGDGFVSGDHAHVALETAPSLPPPAVPAATGERSLHDIPRNSVLLRTHQNEDKVTSSLPLASAAAPSSDEVASMLADRRNRLGVAAPPAPPAPVVPSQPRSILTQSRVRLLESVRSASLAPPDSGGEHLGTFSLTDDLVFRNGSYTSPDLPTPSHLTASAITALLLPGGGSTCGDGDAVSRGRNATGQGDGDGPDASVGDRSSGGDPDGGDPDGSASASASGERDGCLVLPALRTLLAMQDGLPGTGSPVAGPGPGSGRVKPGRGPAHGHGPHTSSATGLTRTTSQYRLSTANSSANANSGAHGSGLGFRHVALAALAVSPPRRRPGVGGAAAAGSGEATRLSRQQATRPAQAAFASMSSPSPSPLALPPALPDGPGGFGPGDDLEPLSRAHSCTESPSGALSSVAGGNRPGGRPNTVTGYTSEGEAKSHHPQQHQGAGGAAGGGGGGSGGAASVAAAAGPGFVSAPVLLVTSQSLTAGASPVALQRQARATSGDARVVSKSQSTVGKSVSSKALFSWTHKLGGMGGKWPWSQAAGPPAAAAATAAGGGGGGAASRDNNGGGAGGCGHSGAVSPEALSPVVPSPGAAITPMAAAALLGIERGSSPMSAPAVPYVTSTTSMTAPAGGGAAAGAVMTQVPPTGPPPWRDATAGGHGTSAQGTSTSGPVQLPPIESIRRRAGGGGSCSGVGVGGSPLESPGLATRGGGASSAATAASSPRRFAGDKRSSASGAPPGGSGGVMELLALTGSSVGVPRQGRLSGAVPREEVGGSPLSLGASS